MRSTSWPTMQPLLKPPFAFFARRVACPTRVQRALSRLGRTGVRVELRDLTCAYVRGRYWDRTSDLCRVKAALSR
jgi:hypothetical protein